MYAVHEDCTHANQHMVIDIAGMQNGIMADRYIVAYVHSDTRRKVNRCIVLDVGALANTDFGKVSTDYRIVKHRRIVANFNIAYDFGTFCDKHAFAEN